jgi:hypothetical protein
MPATLSGFLAMGLWGGFTHCAAMCGPFVLAQTGQGEDFGGVLQRLSRFSLLPYHLGRATTYIALAVLFSAVLNLAFLFLPVRLYIVVPMLLLAAVVFLVSAFPRLSVLFPWAANFHLPAAFAPASRRISALMSSRRAGSRYLLGVMLGFMPCGMLLAALMAAASLDSPLNAGAAMLAFTAGTIPALFLVAAGGHTLSRLYPASFMRARQFFLVLSALWLFVLAGLSIF